MLKALPLALALAFVPADLGVCSTNDAAHFIANTKLSTAKPVDPRTLVRQRASRSGWFRAEWKCLEEIIWRESRWHPHSKNKHSSAYGLFQILGMKPGTPLKKQAEQGIRYIKSRYETPCNALRFHNAHGWY